MIQSDVGSQGRALKKSKDIVMRQYIISKMLVKMSSIAIYKNQPMLFFLMKALVALLNILQHM